MNSDLEDKVRMTMLHLLMKGYTMDQLITALQTIKVEMAMAMQYADAMNEALYQPKKTPSEDGENHT